MAQIEAATKNLRVADIASFNGSAARGYGHLRGNLRIRFVAFDQTFSRNGLVSSPFEIERRNCILPAQAKVLVERPAYFDHAHFQMCNGALREAEMRIIFDSVRTMLAPGGVFFFSAGMDFFSYFWADQSTKMPGRLHRLQAMVAERFNIEFCCAVAHASMVVPTCTAKAGQVAGTLGYSISIDNPKEFFSQFSGFAREHGIFFAIGTKKE